MGYMNTFFIIILIVLLITTLSIFSNSNRYKTSYFPNLYYINLKHRTDRKKHILKQLKMIHYPNNKIIRIDAIKNSNGATGCGLSHIKALKLALQQNKMNDYVIIMEDDFEWKVLNPYPIYLNAINSNIDWNIILLSCNGRVIKYKKSLQRVKSCQTASGYIIKVKYIPTLLKIWERDMDFRLKNNIKNSDKRDHTTCIDQSWKILQKDKWFTTNPIIGKQMKSYSDIEKRVVNYKV